MRLKPYKYQADGAKLIESSEYSAIFADPGMGKTVTVLLALNELRWQEPCKLLIVAPLRVIYNVWPNEVKDWDQFNDIKVEVLHGVDKWRALRRDADVYCINPEGLPWFFAQSDRPDCSWLVIDESTKFKNPRSKRFKLLKKHLDEFTRRTILTGTPVSNGLGDLWAQVFLLDKGESLGRTLGAFRDTFMQRVGQREWNQWKAKEGALKVASNRIKKFTLRLDRDDHLDLPPLFKNWIHIDLPSLAKYKRLEAEMFTELEGAGQLIVGSGAALYGACRQYCSGAVYQVDDETQERHAVHVHDAKLNALADLVDELQGKPILVATQYLHEVDRLRHAFGRVPYLGGGVSAQKGQAIVESWNSGQIPLLIGSPASMSHGLNMQKAGCRDVVWFSLTDDLDQYEQTIDRVYRNGIKWPVTVHHLVAKETIDEALMSLLTAKNKAQRTLLNALRGYRCQ